jgi:hypothetical protein
MGPSADPVASNLVRVCDVENDDNRVGHDDCCRTKADVRESSANTNVKRRRREEFMTTGLKRMARFQEG